jgi:hypothetical protein
LIDLLEYLGLLDDLLETKVEVHFETEVESDELHRGSVVLMVLRIDSDFELEDIKQPLELFVFVVVVLVLVVHSKELGQERFDLDVLVGGRGRKCLNLRIRSSRVLGLFETRDVLFQNMLYHLNIHGVR